MRVYASTRAAPVVHPGSWTPTRHEKIRDTYECVEWAGTQPWSSGKVGMLGISYYATNAWLVATLETPPPHLGAVCPWEGSADFYRDVARHGGILTTWAKNWWSSRVLSVQHGFGERGDRSPNTGELVAGPETLSDAELEANRTDVFGSMKLHVFDDEWTRSRSAVWDNLTVPVLSAANWGSAALHLRGNIEGFVRAASGQKWLEVHGLEHWTHFYTDYGLDIQRRFFDCFLKGDDSGWADQPRVMLNIRRPGEVFELRGEADWPIPDTVWTRMYLQPVDLALTTSPPENDGAVAFDALGEGVRFLTAPLDEELEVTGPVAAKLFVASSTTDADLFLVLHVFDPAGEEVTFQGAMDPLTSVGKGWLRASHRKLDPELTRDYRPYRAHDEIKPLVPGDVYELDVEVWPTSIVVPPGHRIGLSVLGRDYVQGRKDPNAKADFFAQTDVRYGSGPFVHDDPDDRHAAVFDGTTTIHTGPGRPSFLLLPVIPSRS